MTDTTETTGYPTIRDIARQAGVNHSLVSRALHGTGRMSAETRERVLRIARELGYEPSRHEQARRLIARRYGTQVINHTIGVFFTHSGFSRSNYFNNVMQGIFDVVSEAPFEIHTSDTGQVGANGNEPPVVYKRGEIDGILVISLAWSWYPIQERLRAEPSFGMRPIVGLMEHIDGASGVFADSRAAGHTAMSHLLDLGHRLVLSSFAEDDSATSRYSGIAQAYRDRGIDPASGLTTHTWGNEECESRDYVLGVLNRHPEVTAIITQHDQMAVRLYRTLSSCGIRVPADISIISFDDTDAIPGRKGENILTTVRFPLLEIGRQGTELLMRRILGEEPEDRDILLPTELIVRKTTASPRERRLLRV